MNEAIGVIESVDFAAPESLDAIAQLRFTDAGIAAARQTLTTADDRNELWAALWVYGSAPDDAAAVSPLLNHGDASIRMLAAAIAFAIGDRAALPVVQASLNDDTQLLGSQPPATIAEFAASTLVRGVEASGTPALPEPDADESAYHSAWADWLTANAEVLTFDSSTKKWRVP
jgi:hypothetical protein